MATARGLALHDLQVHQNFAGALLPPGKLVAFQVHQAHVFRLHEPFGNERRRAKGQILADPNGDVPAIAINIGARPETPAYLAELQLERVDFGRIEKGLDLGRRAGRSDRPGNPGRTLVRAGGRPGGSVVFELAQKVARGRGKDGVGRERFDIAAVAEQLLDFPGADYNFHLDNLTSMANKKCCPPARRRWHRSALGARRAWRLRGPR